jgi:hypothetical protein
MSKEDLQECRICKVERPLSEFTAYLKRPSLSREQEKGI